MSDASKLDLGHLLTGVIKENACESGLRPTYILECKDEDGKTTYVDLDTLFAKYLGKEVRFTLVTTEAIATMAALVASGESDS